MVQPAEKMGKSQKADETNNQNEQTRTGLNVEALKRAGHHTQES